MYRLSIAAAALGFVILGACGGGDKGTPAEDEEEAQAQVLETPVATKQAEPAGEDEVISLLEQSSEAQRSVDSFRARMDYETKMMGFTRSVRYEYAFRRPDGMYLEEVGPTSSEMVMVMTGGHVFMRLAGAEWEEMPSDVMPFDLESIMAGAYMAEPDPGRLENLQIQEGEVIDGVETVHISYEVDMEKAMGQASDILGEGFSELLGEISESLDLSGKMTVDSWLGKDDKLPRRIQFQMQGKTHGQDYETKTTTEYFDYGEPVEIPSLEEMLERIGG